MFGSTLRVLAGALRGARRWLMTAALPGTLFLCAAAQAAAPGKLRFEHVSIEQGLSQESVLNILQDRQGFMWFGTQAGLNRYDGYRITIYRTDPLDPGSLPDSFVNASFEDAEGRLWFGTKGGLARFDAASGKFVRHALHGPQQAPPAPGRAGNASVNAILADRQGMLWLGTSEGLKRLDPATGAVTLIADPRAGHAPAAPLSAAVTALAIDGHGVLWVGTGHGVARLAPGATRLEHIAPSEPDPRRARILALSMDPRNTLWVGTEAGLEAWDIAPATPRQRLVGAEEGVGEVRVTALYHDSRGALWAGTDLDGLKWRDPASGRFVAYRSLPSDPHSLPDNQVASVRIDRTGTLWVGSRFGGVSRTDLASGGFSHFSFRPASGYRIGFEKTRDIAVRPDGKIWLGTIGGGLVLLDPASGLATQLLQRPGHLASVPSDVIHSLRIEGGRLWVGGAGVLAWCDLDGGRCRRVALPDIGTASVRDVVRTRDGSVWVVTRAGLYELDAGLQVRRAWRHDPADPSSLGDNTLFSMVEDRAGVLWIGTDHGLDRFDRRTGVFTHLRHDPRDPASLRHNRIHDLMLSSRGVLWVGTAGGLHRLERDAAGKAGFRHFPLTDGPGALPIGAVLEDAHGRLWASMTNGISRLDPDSGEFKHYTGEDGLQGGTYFVGAGARGPDGRLHFGGVDGISSFAPDAIRDNPYPPQVRITEFVVFNKPRALPPPAAAAGAGGEGITLSHRESAFGFEFAALHYAAPAANRYAYRLEGFDEDWVETGAGKRFASYMNLDPGRYVFRVRASNKDGVWSEGSAALAVTVTPPWWKTPWFRLLALLLAATAAVLAYRLRVRALVQQKGVLEREVRARTAELVLEKDAAERRKREAERQRVAADEARRNIALLSDIGRRLTANLDTEAIMATLYEHVQVLMEAPVFFVCLARGDGAQLELPYAVLAGRRCRPSARERRDPHELAAWCIDHAREVFINDLEAESEAYLPGVDPAQVAAAALPCDPSAQALPEALPQSLLYVPVVAGQRVLGTLCVQSFAAHAYQRVHLDMLRTLAAYVGVAFDNAQAYRQLKDVQVQLASQEKLVSLGSLVAGVAHELNTPIGNSLLMASTLHDKTLVLAGGLEEGALRRSDLSGYLAAARESSELIVRSLHGAAELVNSFRQVSVDQSSVQRRRFDLARACSEILATMMNRVRLAGHALEIEVPGGIVMDSYPGPLGQVLINFVNNALVHAFAEPGGSMRLSAALLGEDWVRIAFQDDGRGIPAQHLARVFDPFFTTRMGQGGTGLGLNIAHTIVTTVLGGAIRVESEAGRGTRFVLELPLAPAAAPAAPGGEARAAACVLSGAPE